MGNHHPKAVKALIRPLAGNYASVISNVIYTDPLALFLSRTAEFIPRPGPRFGMNGNRVMPENGGVESVETAIKMARYYGFREKKIPDGRLFKGPSQNCRTVRGDPGSPGQRPVHRH